MQQSKTGTDVPRPTMDITYTDSAKAGSKGSSGTPFVASKDLSSDEASAPADEMSTYTSDQATQAIGNGNVKRTGYETPPADLSSVDGGRGIGGY